MENLKLGIIFDSYTLSFKTIFFYLIILKFNFLVYSLENYFYYNKQIKHNYIDLFNQIKFKEAKYGKSKCNGVHWCNR